MSNPIFRRVLWKEYRVQRSLWIAMFVLTAALQAISLIAGMVLGQGDSQIEPLFGLALGLSAFYALGCGATLFAAEHESGTYEFQRMLPSGPMRIFFGKFVFAVASTAVLIGLTWLLAAVLAGWNWPAARIHAGLWALCGFGAVELLVWGIFFSLSSTRPLKAAVLAVTVASVILHFLLAWLNLGQTYRAETYMDPATLPYRAAIVLVVSLANIWLGYRWFDHSTRPGRGRVRIGRAARSDVATPGHTTILGRLVWQQWRQSVGMMGTLAILAVPLGLVGQWAWGNHPFANDRYFVVVVLCCAMASLMGTCVFLADQRKGRFRILAEWGVRPGHVWLSRQVVWMVPAALLTVAVVPLFFFHDLFDIDRFWIHPTTRWSRASSHFSVALGDASEIGFFLGSVALGYASGQLFSMLLRSGLLAAIFGLMLSAVLCGWAGLMWWWEVPWFWSVAPIPFFLLAATRLRTSDWLLQRHRLRAWLRPGLVVVLSLAALPTAVVQYRIHQIPYVDPGFSPEEFARPMTDEERETVELYRQAGDRYVSWGNLLRQHGREQSSDGEVVPEGEGKTEDARVDEWKPTRDPEPTEWETVWLEANEEAITLTLQASRRTACDLFNPTHEEGSLDILRDLGDLLVLSGYKLQSDGELDGARERYLAALRLSVHLRRRADNLWPADHLEGEVFFRLPSWAAHANQTPERIRGLVAQLDQIDKSRPSRTDAIKSRHVWIERIIAGDPDTLGATEMGRDTMIKTMLWARWLPWEQTRARRLLNRQTAADLGAIWEAEANASRNEAVCSSERRYPSYWDWEPSFALRRRVSLPLVQRWSDDIRTLAADLIAIETERRAVRLQLLLRAWEFEHGELPDTLDQLVGPYLDRLPVDPCSGEPFKYFPEGVPIPLRFWRSSSLASRLGLRHGTVLQPDTPFVWSTGLHVYVSEPTKQRVQDRYGIRLRYDEYSQRRHHARTEHEVWQWGEVSPIR